MSDELDEIWTLYADDGRQALDGAEEALLRLKDGPGDRDAIAGLFRAFHSFKGNARVLGLAVTEGLAHRAEDLIGLVRDEGVPLDDALRNLVLETADVLRGMLEETLAARRDADPATTADLVGRMQEKFARCRQGENAPAGADLSAGPAGEPEDGAGVASGAAAGVASCAEVAGGAALEPGEESADGPVGAIVFEPVAASALADDPVYRQLFADLAHAAIKEMRQALAGCGAAPVLPSGVWEIVAGEAERLRFAAEQIGLPDWMAALTALLTCPEPSAAEIDSTLAAMEAMAVRDFPPPAAPLAPIPAPEPEPESEVVASGVIPTSSKSDSLPAASPACAGRQGTLSPDTPSQRPKGLWEPVEGNGSNITLNGMIPEEAGWDAAPETAVVTVDAAPAGSDGPYEPLEAAGAIFVTGGAESAAWLERRLGLPPSFHNVLTPESVKTAGAALEAGHHFYIVRAALNGDQEIAGRFFEWIGSGAIQAVSNVTVFDAATTLFDFLLCGPVNEAELAQALAALDPDRRSLTLERVLCDRDAGGGGAGLGTGLDTGDRDRDRDRDGVSGDMLEAVGGIVAGQAMVHRMLADLAEEDLFWSVGARVRDAGGDWSRAEGAVQHYLEGVHDRLDQVLRAEARLGGLAGRLQEEAIAARGRSASLLLKPLEAFIDQTARHCGRQVAVSITGEDLTIDVAIQEALTLPLRAITAFCVTQSLETPERRVAADKDRYGSLRIGLACAGDHVTVTVEDDGIGIDPARVVQRLRRLGRAEDNPLVNSVLRPGYGVTANTEAEADTGGDTGVGVGTDTGVGGYGVSCGGVDFAVLSAGLRSRGGGVRIVALPTGGVRFHLVLPLTMAVLEGMAVRVGKVVYVIPIDAIQRIVHAGGGALMRVSAERGRTMLNLGRDALLPVRFLNPGRGDDPAHDDGDALAAAAAAAKVLFVVVGRPPQQAALVVDELVGQQLVLIRPLQGYLAGIRGVTGCALLAGGEVGMVLDPGYVLGYV